MFKKYFSDSFQLGFLFGCIPVAACYFLWVNYDLIMSFLGNLKFSLYPPRVQLIVLAISFIIFRFMMVKWNMIKTGKGFFITIFTSFVIYCIINRNKLF